MKIYIKFGTHSARWMRVARLRKPPKVGDHFYVYEDHRADCRYPRKIGVYLHEIRDVGGTGLYVAELM